MGTWVSIKVCDSFRKPKQLKSVIKKAFSEIENVDRLLSRFNEKSEVSGINTLKPFETIKVSVETVTVLNKSEEINKITDGAFDVTVLPLIKLWGAYGGKNNLVPPRHEVKKALEFVGPDNLLFDKQYGNVSVLKQGVGIDLSGIAKGFAVDRAIESLRRDGIKNAMIDAGGDIYCLGSGPEGRPWQIGLKHPRENKIITTLQLRDMAVATSGDYENYILINGERFSHIIDPRTGYPVKDAPISVTVLAADCITADALATAISVMGAEKGLALVNTLEWVEAVIISEGNDSLKIDVSEGLKEIYEFQG